MSTTPAALTARLKAEYPMWLIERKGELYRAAHRDREQVIVAAWADLIRQLSAIENRGG